MQHEWSGLSPEVRHCRAQRGRERERCYFELMAVATFKAGLNYGVVNAKWDAIRDAFHWFDPSKVAAMGGGEIERIEADARVIRSRRKIEGVVDNAHKMLEIEREHGGFAEWLDSMPDPETRIAGLHREFAFMGPSTAYYFLHYAGEDVPGWHEWAERHPEIMGWSRERARHS
ncbi:MAG TPA: DNA-3-methyladenine glycosylase I [Coriobacteriia bacterium]|jgi:DNA-3-methyladenine glycosylase I